MACWKYTEGNDCGCVVADCLLVSAGEVDSPWLPFDGFDGICVTDCVSWRDGDAFLLIHVCSAVLCSTRN